MTVEENIDYETLANSILEQLDDSISNNYDIETVLKSAKLCWDNTAVQVTGRDFEMVFDLISYEILDYNGNDIN